MSKRPAKLAFRIDSILDNEPAMKTASLENFYTSTCNTYQTVAPVSAKKLEYFDNKTLAFSTPVIMSTCISPPSSSNAHQCTSQDITPLTKTHSNNPPSDKPNTDSILKSNQHPDTITTSTETTQNGPPISTDSNTPQQEPYSNDVTIPAEPSVNSPTPTAGFMGKPTSSYIALIGMAINSNPTNKMLLSQIYDFITHNYSYYRNRKDNSWRNSIRHNLSFNECFVKSERSTDGKGFYWSIHPANLEDFKQENFSRRHAITKIREYMVKKGQEMKSLSSTVPNRSVCQSLTIQTQFDSPSGHSVPNHCNVSNIALQTAGHILLPPTPLSMYGGNMVPIPAYQPSLIAQIVDRPTIPYNCLNLNKEPLHIHFSHSSYQNQPPTGSGPAHYSAETFERQHSSDFNSQASQPQ